MNTDMSAFMTSQLSPDRTTPEGGGGGGVKGLGHELSVLYCIQGTGKVGGGGNTNIICT